MKLWNMTTESECCTKHNFVENDNCNYVGTTTYIGTCQICRAVRIVSSDHGANVIEPCNSEDLHAAVVASDHLVTGSESEV